MIDVAIAGAGPAGCVAAIVLARAGARVLLVDRATFPRDKLCGDTLNPGALGVLRRLNIGAAEDGLPIRGMLVTGPGGVRVEAHYPAGLTGRALLRRNLDGQLLQAASDAGATIHQQAVVQGAFVSDSRGVVSGLRLRYAGSAPSRLDARLVIAADGRESRLARTLGLAAHPRRPRRWAVGAYFTDVKGMGPRGEMHVRPGQYIGVSPLRGGLANVCIVTADRARLRSGPRLLTDAVRAEPELADRFCTARMETDPVTLGPLAVECGVAGMPGLLLAGDAGGFIDPMTGDGLRFALRGGELAAQYALRALETGDLSVHEELAAVRRREFSAKWRFNRALRGLAGSADAVRLAGLATRMSSWPLSRIIRYAGDVTAA